MLENYSFKAGHTSCASLCTSSSYGASCKRKTSDNTVAVQRARCKL